MKRFFHLIAILLVASSTFGFAAGTDGDEAGDYPLLLAIVLLVVGIVWGAISNRRKSKEGIPKSRA